MKPIQHPSFTGNTRKATNRIFHLFAQLTVFAAFPIAATLTPAYAADVQQESKEAPGEYERPKVKIAGDFLLSVDGYIAASGTLTQPKGEHRQTTLFNSGSDSLDAVKTGLNFEYKDSGAVASIFYVPGHRSDSEAGVLDAYVFWKTGLPQDQTFTITAGKFTSYLGFEGFHPVERDSLTYALIAGIPAYHTGIKADYEADPFTVGLAVVDSLQEAGGFHQGDGNLRDVGLEFCVSVKALDEELEVFGGIGYDTDEKTRSEHGLPGREFEAVNNLFLDFFATYKLTENLTLGAEVAYTKNISDLSWLVQATWAFNDALSVTGHLSGAKFENHSQGYQFALAPQWQPVQHLILRGEVSYLHVCGGERCWFFGAQTIFQF
jgi:hypothetical protein